MKSPINLIISDYQTVIIFTITLICLIINEDDIDYK